MPVRHELWLVALSVFIAIQGAYVGLSLAAQISAARGMRRRLLLAGSAVSLAVAIWAMHFVGMLAARLPFPVDYLVFPTLLSFLVCVLVVGAAVFAASAGPRTRTRLAAAAVFMGLGIVSMHYIGMTALHASAHMVHAPLFVVASAAVAIFASGFALWLTDDRGARPPLILSAAALGLAISGMHYTAMAGMLVFSHHPAEISAPALSPDLLAIVVAVVAFLVSGIFLLTLVPDPAFRAGRPAADVRLRWGHTEQAEATPGTADSTSANVSAVGSAPARVLPVERDGATHFVPVDEIVAVHANAHYTYVFDGSAKFFCSLSIGEVENRLDPARFVRVHRSHIVNVARIAGLKRAGDNGVIELAGGAGYTVPVSRARFGGLKTLLAPGPRRAVPEISSPSHAVS